MSLADDHHHCKVCGAVCAPGDLVCSEACRAKREAKLRSGRTLQLMMYGAMFLLLVVLLFELRL